MRIVTCPKCDSTHCIKIISPLNSGWVTDSTKLQCQDCGYYAERKEFDIKHLYEIDMHRAWFDKQ